MRPLLFRLTPGTDLKQGILEKCAIEKVKTGVIISAVGSLTHAVIRIADGKTVIERTGPFELISLSGTISANSTHCHLSLYDEHVNTFGGHLMEGCLIHTTMEISIMDLSDEFDTARQPDPQTGYDELVVTERKLKPKKL